jgi:ABC-2 type transport system ATP-binding protein
VAQIAIQDISRKFGKIHALAGITLEVGEGEILGLLGPNGSGKSTLLRILSFLLPASNGSLSLLGKPVYQRDPVLLQQMGVVFDQTAHYEHLTGYENAWFFARAYGVDASEAEIRLRDLFTALDLWDRKDDPVGVYSHGMKRKLALIEALAHRPRVILLDEPSLGLDYHARMSLYQILKNEAESGTSIVVATNDVHEARLLCDRVALMNQGRLLTIGPPEFLINSLGGFAVLDVKLDRPIPLDILKQVEGITQVEVLGGGGSDVQIRVLAHDDPQILPLLIAEIAKHASLIGMEVKRPDLGDVMLRFGGGT